MKKSNLSKIILIGILVLSSIILFLPPALSQGVKAKVFEEKMECEDEDVVSDEQWQWYECVVEIGEKIEVKLHYDGELDLDMRLYWKRENIPQFRGFDLTHCDINSERYNYSEYSQFRTTDTGELGYPEELYLINPSYTKPDDKLAYILVYVHSGEGKSKYTLVSDKDLVRIEDDDVYDCNFVNTLFLGFALASAGIFGVYVFMVLRKKKKITELKEEEKPRKVEKKLETIDLDTIVEQRKK